MTFHRLRSRALAFTTMLALMALAVLVSLAPARADGQEGYYYPPVTSEETFDRVLVDAPPAEPGSREAFVTLITRAQLEAPSPPQFALFAKGADDAELIMVALEDDVFRTLFRARGVLAQLSAQVRDAPAFAERGLSARATFFDMLQILDFESLTITDGVSWSHRVNFN